MLAIDDSLAGIIAASSCKKQLFWECIWGYYLCNNIHRSSCIRSWEILLKETASKKVEFKKHQFSWPKTTLSTLQSNKDEAIGAIIKTRSWYHHHERNWRGKWQRSKPKGENEGRLKKSNRKEAADSGALSRHFRGCSCPPSRPGPGRGRCPSRRRRWCRPRRGPSSEARRPCPVRRRPNQ